MQIQRQNDTISMTLDPSCTIVDVEEHTQRVKDIFAQPGLILRFELNADLVEEIDTAYLQLLLTIRNQVQGKGGKAILEKPPKAFTEALICYGIRND